MGQAERPRQIAYRITRVSKSPEKRDNYYFAFLIVIFLCYIHFVHWAICRSIGTRRNLSRQLKRRFHSSRRFKCGDSAQGSSSQEVNCVSHYIYTYIYTYTYTRCAFKKITQFYFVPNNPCNSNLIKRQ